jgi:hypothetical protein
LKEIKPVHEVTLAYFQKGCEAWDNVDLVMFDEWVFHALGCGEEGRLPDREADWLIIYRTTMFSGNPGGWGNGYCQKKTKLSIADDGFLLNSVACTMLTIE